LEKELNQSHRNNFYHLILSDRYFQGLVCETGPVIQGPCGNRCLLGGAEIVFYSKSRRGKIQDIKNTQNQISLDGLDEDDVNTLIWQCGIPRNVANSKLGFLVNTSGKFAPGMFYNSQAFEALAVWVRKNRSYAASLACLHQAQCLYGWYERSISSEW
jgi:hypothetical protein